MLLWVMAEVAIIGSDIQEVIGSAIALSILSRGALRLWQAALVSAATSFLLLLVERAGERLGVWALERAGRSAARSMCKGRGSAGSCGRGQIGGGQGASEACAWAYTRARGATAPPCQPVAKLLRRWTPRVPWHRHACSCVPLPLPQVSGSWRPSLAASSWPW